MFFLSYYLQTAGPLFPLPPFSLLLIISTISIYAFSLFFPTWKWKRYNPTSQEADADGTWLCLPGIYQQNLYLGLQWFIKHVCYLLTKFRLGKNENISTREIVRVMRETFCFVLYGMWGLGTKVKMIMVHGRAHLFGLWFSLSPFYFILFKSFPFF